jgi:hypothetical protein
MHIPLMFHERPGGGRSRDFRAVALIQINAISRRLTYKALL